MRLKIRTKNGGLALLAIVLLFSPVACFGTLDKNESPGSQVEQVTKADDNDLTLVYATKGLLNHELIPNGQLEFYISDIGARAEVHIHVNRKKVKMNMDAVMIMKWEDPDKMVLLYPTEKKYRIMSRKDINNKNANKATMEVIGKVKWNGYNCTRVNVATTKARRDGTRKKIVTKYWLTKDVSGYENAISRVEAMAILMKEENTDIFKYGIPVKQVEMEGGEIHNVMELTKTEQKDIPGELFEIPKEYEESE